MNLRAFLSGQLDWQYLHYRNAIGWTVFVAVFVWFLRGWVT